MTGDRASPIVRAASSARATRFSAADRYDFLFAAITLVAWPLACGASAAVLVKLHQFQSVGAARPIILLHSLGGVFAIVIWLPLHHWWISRLQQSVARFAVAFVLLAALTAAACAALFALDFWFYFSQWHEPFFSRIGVYQAVFTAISAVFQYAVLGARYLVPVALPAGLLIGLAAARRSH